MTLRRLLWRSLAFHWRGNLAVALGVAVGAAVLTGALLVGDSLRGSLRDLTERQLGWVDQVLVSNRFFRQALGRELAGGRRAAPVIALQGSVKNSSTGRRVGQVAIWGVDVQFWSHEPIVVESALPDPIAPAASRERQPQYQQVVQQLATPMIRAEQVAISAALARELGVEVGQAIVVHLQKASAIPRESLLGRREADHVLEELKLTVDRVIADEDYYGRFSLNPSPMPPRNLFVPLETLQQALGQTGRVNAILFEGDDPIPSDDLKKLLTLEDWGLVIRTPDRRTRELFDRLDRNRDQLLGRNEWQHRLPEALVRAIDDDGDGVLSIDRVREHYRRQRPYASLESRQILLEPAAASAAVQAAREVGLQAAPTFVYLANRLTHGGEQIPYSVVAALEPTRPPPLGPFLPAGVDSLADDEIVLAHWTESPLKLEPGDPVELVYFAPEETVQPRERTATFRFKGYVPLEGAADDADLTPEFPGITDQRSVAEWEPPSSFDRRDIQKRVGQRDEDWWKDRRTTPKAYITLAAGQRLWGSRFGNLTSIRLARPARGEKTSVGRQPADPAELEQAAEDFRRALLSHLEPEQGGFVIDPVRDRSRRASGGGLDFGGLFLGFSFFLIAAALLLVGLLFRLNLDRRADEVGLLLAAGYRLRTVRRLLLAEGTMLAAVGALAGLALALLYAWFLLDFLAAFWPGGLDRSLLRLHVTGQSLLLGYLAALLVSVLTIAWAVRLLGKVPPRSLLAGQTSGEWEAGRPERPLRWSRWLAPASALAGAALLAGGGRIDDHEGKAFAFFSGGALLLTAGLSAVWMYLRHGEGFASPQPSVARLGRRNAGRQPVRSLLTAGLIAAAAFLVVAVESFRRQPDRDFLDKDSGSGGFILLAETDLPIFQDLNTPKGREQLDLSDRAEEVCQNVTVFSLRLRPGDDASCLNLYKPERPRLLGVPDALIRRGGFHFAATAAHTPEQQANPWLLLQTPLPDGATPVFGEKNSVQWMLGKGLGDDLEIADEKGQPVRLRIVGLLKDSVFQSGLLLAEASFLRLYPGQEGYQFFLIDSPPEQAAAVEQILEQELAKRGFEATPTAERLALYLAVENTYLSTFQLLGGFGLLLGALGLAVVLVRTVWERRGELALLRALGFKRSALGWLLLAENGFLLALGLAVGTLSAVLAVLPQVVAGDGQVPWLRLAALLSAVLLVGLATAALAARRTLRAPLIPALRRE